MEGYAIDREFEDVAAVIDWAGEAVDVVAHSYGGVCALEAALPDARVVVLPGQRHVAMDTAPALFTAEVMNFLD